MTQIVNIITYCIKAVQVIAIAWAGFKLCVYGTAYMRKNAQKVEEAKDGMKNVVGGLVVVLGCQAIVQFLKNGMNF
ncbi:MAG: hypothetical protein ACRCW0_04930 [Clostridium sp.]|uniref:Uncharacterized protein n=2 Tax=Paraclostridium bifermentans TaxID=1490 RepID=A0A5P3XKG0_PARBF|nr:hypothetical protein [Paraclostridium bifermentans]EQK39991.1 putative membrane protein [[Clostridium] bifermentans ATCC 638] [Paraclostridium bifermentans ATCC 638 = DSM 14991]EQK41129.1 putative membrane protein [[Clostridium] bifermentans ATCC 19299] [Paraclostridium bifermentans ATCC 19299]QEZ70795.1 hypothetical protein D4A35_17815 [Paraclostridium bifermentans]RIZ57384.1 hypothetical protein CHH45_16560 [Paraclostridium bifermentans]UAG19941.1 hypothetical protein KXZ80_17205 [Paraclo